MISESSTLMNWHNFPVSFYRVVLDLDSSYTCQSSANATLSSHPIYNVITQNQSHLLITPEVQFDSP